MDPWVPEVGPLLDYVSSNLSVDVTVTVADMAMPDGRWRWFAFEHLLPCFVLLRIAVICRPKPHLPSAWISWEGAMDHHFSIKSEYRCRIQPTLALISGSGRNVVVFDALDSVYGESIVDCSHRMQANTVTAIRVSSQSQQRTLLPRT
ncbi:hypothetical protein V6N13_110598 [Hibiscus sabdariffa]